MPTTIRATAMITDDEPPLFPAAIPFLLAFKKYDCLALRLSPDKVFFDFVDLHQHSGRKPQNHLATECFIAHSLEQGKASLAGTGLKLLKRDGGNEVQFKLAISLLMVGRMAKQA